MIMPWVYELGKLVVMELNFPNLPDEKIAVGQWIVLWDEILIRKIGSNIYEVYPDAKPYEFETMEERLEKLAKGFAFREITDADMYLNGRDMISVGRNLIKDGQKYIRKNKGSEKRHPWESPRFFY